MEAARNWRPTWGELNAVLKSHASGREVGLRFDEAIAKFGAALPGRGLKLIVPPPLLDGRRARVSLSAWSRADAFSRVHSGTHASQAMARLFAAEAEAERQQHLKDHCAICRGLGWYIGWDGTTVVCRHL